MEKMKSLFSGGKSKVYALVILQGAIGLFVGNYFIRPALVTTAIVSRTIATSSLPQRRERERALGQRLALQPERVQELRLLHVQLVKCLLLHQPTRERLSVELQEPMRNVPVMQLNQRLERIKHSS